MRRTVLILISLMFSLALCGTSLQIRKPQSDVINLRFTLPEFYKESTLQDGKEITKLRISNADEEDWNENFSGFPQLNGWVYIPEGYQPQVTIQNQMTNLIPDSDYVKQDNTGDNSNWIDVSQSMVLRGNRILSFCIKPFHYDNNSKILTTLDQAEINISFIPQQTGAVNPSLLTPTTANLLKSMCVNRNDIRMVSQNPGSYVILYNSSTILNYIQPLADWKHQKGYDVRLVDTSTIGNSTTSIKNYLQTAYDTWDNPPEFILIFGRSSSSTYSVPTYSEYFNYNTVGDYKYTLLDGTDLIPDAYIGRITFNSTDELQTEVNRLLSYEKMQNLSTSTNWLNKSFLVGDPSESGESCVTTAQYIKSLISDYNSNILCTEAYSGPFPSQINAALNSGTGTYWYRGHGDFSGWTSTDINNLSNAGKYFFFSYITCFTGNFGSSSVSQAERLIRLGTPTVPRGAIGVIAASCETHTCLNNIVTAGAAQGLYSYGLTQGGPAMVRGKLALMANYPQNPANYINQYMQQINLIGDPGLDIWLSQVNEIQLIHPTTININGGNMAIRVTNLDGSPVENAWVSLTKDADEIYTTGFTNGLGWVVLDYGPSTSGTAVLTVTKPNHRPYQANLTVNSSAESISLQDITDLQECHAGSVIEFPITIENNGAGVLPTVTGILQSYDNYVLVTQDSVQFINVIPGIPASSPTDFEIHINSDTPKGSTLYLNLHLTSGTDVYDVPITCIENGPDIQLVSAVFSNNVLNHGVNNLAISLHNIGTSSVSGLQAILESSNPLVTVQNPNQSLGNVNPDATLTLPSDYIINVADSLLEGISVNFVLELFNSNGFIQSISISKEIGTVSANDITGPDDYGYICYGQSDDGYIPYNWVEIDPNQGGSGTVLNMSDSNLDGSGATTLITIPFQFRFYGINYGQLSICSNGFVMPGNQTSVEWMNWQIPGPLVPRPIIAPFWDDLLLDYSSRVVYKYDSTINAEIIQWQNLKNRFNTSLRETFQVVLYDPVYHTSPTGDSPILFQYKLFNNVDAGSYGVNYIDHGQYATIGIADHTGKVGIGYSFNNQYPPTAQMVQNFTTLYFTTLPTYQTAPEPIILNCITNELTGNDNGQADAGEELSLEFVVKNIGLGAITESQVTLSSSDSQVSILQNQAILPNLVNNQILTTSPAFVVQIAPLCPNQHVLNFTLHIQNDVDEFDLSFDMMVNALEFTCTDFIYTDSNNDFPEPGENGQFSFTVHNLSLLDGTNLSLSINAPAEIIIAPVEQIISIPAQSSLQVTFSISIGTGAEQGEAIELGIDIALDGSYSATQPYAMLIGVPDVFLNTGFEEADISAVFQAGYNLSVLPANYIHTTGHELAFDYYPGNPYSYAYLYPINTTDLQAVQINFTWFSTYSGSSFSLMALYPNQSNLFSVWSSNEGTPIPDTVTVTMTDFSVGAEYMILVLYANFAGTDPGILRLDDLSVLTVHHAPGFIAGHVNLDLFTENVTQVRISDRYSTTIYHPDAQGNYQIPAYQGLNVIVAYLDGYLNTVDSLAVNVVSGQVSPDNDIYFQRLCAPTNVTYSLEDNLITLNWELEGQSVACRLDKPLSQSNKTDFSEVVLIPEEKKSASRTRDLRYLLPDYYKIFVRINNLNFNNTTDDQTWSYTAYIQGNYQIYICSVFLINGTEETLSLPSETIEFNYTSAADEQNQPVPFALSQNRPNPFNPDTRIAFSLPENSDVNLCIYNLKGQLVTTLVESELNKGNHTVTWNGKDSNGILVSSGIYYYRLRWNGKELVRKMTLLK